MTSSTLRWHHPQVVVINWWVKTRTLALNPGRLTSLLGHSAHFLWSTKAYATKVPRVLTHSHSVRAFFSSGLPHEDLLIRDCPGRTRRQATIRNPSLAVVFRLPNSRWPGKQPSLLFRFLKSASRRNPSLLSSASLLVTRFATRGSWPYY